MSEIDDLLDLPEDPELAFVVFERRHRQMLWDSINQDTSLAYEQERKMHYFLKVTAFHDAHNFTFLQTGKLRRHSEHFEFEFDKFADEVSYWTTQIEVRQSQRLRPISTILKLTPEIRQHLHTYVSKIRQTISELQLDTRKKKAILGKLNSLADEIDRDRTKAEALTALTLEIASVGGQAAKELIPVRDTIHAIAGLFGKAKAMAEEVLMLPSAVVKKRIEGPSFQSKPISLPEINDGVDEIPF